MSKHWHPGYDLKGGSRGQGRRISFAEIRLMLLAGVMAGLAYAWLPGATEPAGTAVSAGVPAEVARSEHVRVIDGDTFDHRGERIRIADIDTPETHQARCAEEAALGEQATRRLQVLLAQGPFELQQADRDEDRYGRKLRIVMRGGESIGTILVAEGLARPWTGRRLPWCA